MKPQLYGKRDLFEREREREREREKKKFVLRYVSAVPL